MRQAVFYLRVSTIDQTTANQERELRAIAARIGWWTGWISFVMTKLSRAVIACISATMMLLSRQVDHEFELPRHRVDVADRITDTMDVAFSDSGLRRIRRARRAALRLRSRPRRDRPISTFHSLSHNCRKTYLVFPQGKNTEHNRNRDHRLGQDREGVA
jgi:hypothetical protein